jgi:hypothetical protein
MNAKNEISTLEYRIEHSLKERLEGIGFKVLKLVTPGTAGTMDRLILRPIWSPGAPIFVECKRPGKTERRLQELVRDDWRKRGCYVLDVCDSFDRVDEIYMHLAALAHSQRIDGL